MSVIDRTYLVNGHGVMNPSGRRSRGRPSRGPRSAPSTGSAPSPPPWPTRDGFWLKVANFRAGHPVGFRRMTTLERMESEGWDVRGRFF